MQEIVKKNNTLLIVFRKILCCFILFHAHRFNKKYCKLNSELDTHVKIGSIQCQSLCLHALPLLFTNTLITDKSPPTDSNIIPQFIHYTCSHLLNWAAVLKLNLSNICSPSFLFVLSCKYLVYCLNEYPSIFFCHSLCWCSHTTPTHTSCPKLLPAYMHVFSLYLYLWLISVTLFIPQYSACIIHTMSLWVVYVVSSWFYASLNQST